MRAQQRARMGKVSVMLEGCVSLSLMEGVGDGLLLVLVGVGPHRRLEIWNSAFVNRKGAGKEPKNSCFLFHLAPLEIAIFGGVRKPGFWSQFCYIGTA